MRPGRELLAAIAAGEAEPQTEVVARYRPVLQAFARRVGVEEALINGASDAAFAALFEALRENPFDPRLETRERLFVQARDHVADASLTASDVLQSEDAMRRAWNTEWRQGLVRYSIRALAQAQETEARALQAFELHAIEKRNVAEVARELNMTLTAVFAAKNLVRAKLEALILRLEYEF